MTCLAPGTAKGWPCTSLSSSSEKYLVPWGHGVWAPATAMVGALLAKAGVI